MALVACVRPVPQSVPVTMGPVTTAHQVEYVVDAMDAATVEAARALVVRMRVDAGANNAGPFEVLMLPITCVAATPDPGWQCVANLPAAMVTRINAAGAHTVSLAVAVPAGESPGSVPYLITTAGTPGPGPAAPTGSRFMR